MKLTGKSKEKFIFWMCKNNEYVRWHEYETMPECAINALIIEFFDSVGIYVNVLKYDGYWKFIVDFQYRYKFDFRYEAINAAIEKANEIFNLNNKT